MRTFSGRVNPAAGDEKPGPTAGKSGVADVPTNQGFDLLDAP